MSTFSFPSAAHLISESQRRANRPAGLFNAARAAGRQRRFWARLARRSTQLRRLPSALPRAAGHYAGLRTVEIARIRGSEGRTADFDDQFYPLADALRQRWQRVASALEDDLRLPPVVLIQVGDEYFVRDGHHRISVTRALGQDVIEADVTVWGTEL
jgi:hypothetical protein